jgi:hypothetical protein
MEIFKQTEFQAQGRESIDIDKKIYISEGRVKDELRNFSLPICKTNSNLMDNFYPVRVYSSKLQMMRSQNFTYFRHDLKS